MNGCRAAREGSEEARLVCSKCMRPSAAAALILSLPLRCYRCTHACTQRVSSFAWRFVLLVMCTEGGVSFQAWRSGASGTLRRCLFRRKKNSPHFAKGQRDLLTLFALPSAGGTLSPCLFRGKKISPHFAKSQRDLHTLFRAAQGLRLHTISHLFTRLGALGPTISSRTS